MSPTKEGPLFFSDAGLGIHVISHTFFLKDSSARGFQRWFSLIALGWENAALLQLWTVLVPEMKELIGELQQMAALVYQREEEQCSHRMLRSNVVHHHLTNVGAARSLQDMTGNPVVLTKLHTKLSRMVLLTHRSDRVIIFHRREYQAVPCNFCHDFRLDLNDLPPTESSRLLSTKKPF